LPATSASLATIASAAITTVLVPSALLGQAGQPWVARLLRCGSALLVEGLDAILLLQQEP
jgi:hypothetical protein